MNGFKIKVLTHLLFFIYCLLRESLCFLLTTCILIFYVLQEESLRMFCECGHTLQGSARFCSQCRKEVLATQTTQIVPCPNTVQKDKRIPVCGAEIQSSNKFCSGCGWFIDTKAFLQGAAMCGGNKRSGEPCDNIVTPNIRFCSECGKPPESCPLQETSALSKLNILKLLSFIEICDECFFVEYLEVKMFQATVHAVPRKIYIS